MSDRIKMTVEMDVTVPQGLALQAMFRQWNRLASAGSSRDVSFFVDGDGNFKPKCAVSFSSPTPDLTSELEEIAAKKGSHGLKFDFDAIAWRLDL